MNPKYRTHTCNQLRGKNRGENVKLSGWVARVRDLGGLSFFDLRDKYGKTQVVFDSDSPLLETVKTLKSEDVVCVEGVVRHRPGDMVNRGMPSGEVEVVASSLTVLARSIPLPMGVEDVEDASDELRLRYRYLDLRRPRMQRNLALRHKATLSMRRYHDEQGFTEVETPCLIRSTPEGARDFIVPSRLHRGSFYSLPQSPQIYKQTLIIGGLDKYFQIVRCFRDEDARADRQPEFSQVDLEMAFIDEEDVYAHCEGMMKRLIEDLFAKPLATPFPRITYSDAIETFGSDAPDLRYDLKFSRCDEYFHNSGFKAFEGVLQSGGMVYGFRAGGKGGLSRTQRNELEKLAKKEGLAGLLNSPVEGGGLTGVLGKVLNDETQGRLILTLGAADGDLLLFAAGKREPLLTGLGRLRRELACKWGLADPNTLAFCWVTEAPAFETGTDGESLTYVHHPFTAIREEDVDLIETDPLAARSRAYDLVLNGIELGSGSVRIHDAKLQERVFKAIGIEPDEARQRFGFLMEALTCGSPPHGGIALGLDRVVMLLAGENSIREVTAFPKTTVATSLMDGSPAPVDDEQLDELGLSLVKNRKIT